MVSRRTVLHGVYYYYYYYYYHHHRRHCYWCSQAVGSPTLGGTLLIKVLVDKFYILFTVYLVMILGK